MSQFLGRAGSALAVTAILLAGGCATDDEQDDTAAAPEPPAAPAPADPPETDVPANEAVATEVPVLLAGSEVLLPASVFPAGTYTFVVEQEGEEPYALNIMGPDVSESTSEVVPGGEPEELTVTLGPGTYELWSSVDGEPEVGTEVTIEVLEEEVEEEETGEPETDEEEADEGAEE